MPRVGVNCRFGLVAERLALLSVTHAFEESEGCQAMRSRVRPRLWVLFFLEPSNNDQRILEFLNIRFSHWSLRAPTMAMVGAS